MLLNFSRMLCGTWTSSTTGQVNVVVDHDVDAGGRRVDRVDEELRRADSGKLGQDVRDGAADDRIAGLEQRGEHDAVLEGDVVEIRADRQVVPQPRGDAAADVDRGLLLEVG